jgi:hypothetical protein
MGKPAGKFSGFIGVFAGPFAGLVSKQAAAG